MKNRYGLLLAMLLFAACLGSQAQAKENMDPAKLPTLLGSSNAGTDFWFSFPVCWSQFGDNNALKIYVSSGAAVQCTLEIPGIGKYIVKTTKPNDIIDFSLFPGEGQLYEKDGAVAEGARSEEETHAEGKGRGIHITAPAPIIVYGVSRFIYTSDSFLALPTSALGKEYIIASYSDVTAPFPGQHLMSQTNIVAPYDNTVITFTLGGSYGTQTVGNMKRGDKKTFKLNKGDAMAFANKKLSGQSVYLDLSGSKIVANKPIAVTSGNMCAYIDVNSPACDFIMEMELPTTTWGKEYHVTRFGKRTKYAFMKIFAKNPNTRLFKDGNPTAFYTIKTAGGLENVGYYQGRVHDDGNAPRPMVIKADGPISITQYNPGQADDGVINDPDQLILTPIEQYQKEITFCTPGIKGGQGFAENYLNVVFEGAADGTIPEDLEFAEVNDGKFKWVPVRAKFGGSAEAFKSFPGDTKKYFQKMIQLPYDGVFKIRAQKPFAAYAYGAGNYDGYAHPTSVALGDLSVNDPDTPEFSFTQLCDGSVNDGKVTDLPKVDNDTIKRSNMSIITLIEGSSNYILEKEDFVAGDARTAWWKLRVEDPTQDAIANVYFADRAGNDTTVTITYAPPAMKLEKTSLSYGLLKTNESKTLQLVVRNSSTTMAQRITNLTIKGTPASGFTFVTQPVFPDTILPEGSRTYDIAFMSAIEGDNFKDSIIIEVNDCNKIGAELLAKVGEPIIDVTNVPFGTVPVNSSNTKQLTVTNRGKVELVVSGATGPKDTKFTLTGNGWDITTSNPLKLQPGASQNLDISFKSDVVNTYIDTVFFISNATTIKDYSVLTAKTTQGQLSAIGYQWPEKRINKTYGDGFIILENSGNAPITITNSQKIGTDASAFNVPAYGNKTLEAKAKDTIYNVTFTPNRIGNFESQVEFTTQDGSVTADLTGMGIVPRISMEPLKDFGETPVFGSTPNKRQIVITNEAYEWDDSVTITDFTATPTGSIAWTAGSYGSEGFGFDKASLIGTGLVIQPGKTAVIEAEFIARKENGASAEIRPVSDAENNDEVLSVWTGFGRSEGVLYNTNTDEVCINDDGTITLTIINDKNSDAVIENITPTAQNPAAASFTVITPLPLTVEAGTSRTVDLRVSSPVTGTNTAILVVTRTGGAEDTVTAFFTTKDYARTSSIARNIIAEVGETKQIAIKLDNGENFDLADVNRLDIELNYNPLLIQVEQGTLATSVNDFTIAPDPVIDAANGVVRFSLIPKTTGFIPRSGELTLATMNFSAYLNGKPVDSTELTHTVTVVGNECLKINSAPGLITVAPVCGGDVRRINVGSTQYALQISPNPVTNGQAEIRFSIGLTGYTSIEIVNSMGVVVGTLVNQVLVPDEYSIPLNTEMLGSGMYYYRIISGPYTETKKMMITK